MNTRIERMKLQISQQEDKLIECAEFCQKFMCQDTQEKCIQETEVLESLKRRLEEAEKEEAKRVVSEKRSAPLKAKYPILAQVTAAAPAWDIIEGVVGDEKYTTDQERELALEICLQRLSRSAQ